MAMSTLMEVRTDAARLTREIRERDLARQARELLAAQRQLQEQNEALTFTLAELIRKADTLILKIQAPPDELAADREPILAESINARQWAFDRMGEVNGDQAWFWTPEWQAKEREADAALAAGRVTCFESDEAFLAALEARTGNADA